MDALPPSAGSTVNLESMFRLLSSSTSGGPPESLFIYVHISHPQRIPSRCLPYQGALSFPQYNGFRPCWFQPMRFAPSSHKLLGCLNMRCGNRTPAYIDNEGRMQVHQPLRARSETSLVHVQDSMKLYDTNMVPVTVSIWQPSTPQPQESSPYRGVLIAGRVERFDPRRIHGIQRVSTAEKGANVYHCSVRPQTFPDMQRRYLAPDNNDSLPETAKFDIATLQHYAPDLLGEYECRAVQQWHMWEARRMAEYLIALHRRALMHDVEVHSTLSLVAEALQSPETRYRSCESDVLMDLDALVTSLGHEPSDKDRTEG